MAAMVLILILIAMDIVTGLIKAYVTKTFSSKIMREGLVRKSGTIFLVLLAYGLQYASGYIPELPVELGAVYGGVSLYVMLMEIASNVENILVINPELGGETIRKFFNVTKPKPQENQEEAVKND